MDFFDSDHYLKVRRARKKLGFEESDNKLKNVKIKDHPYIGKTIKGKSDGKIYTIEGVNKQWYKGFYLGMLISHNGSHAFLYFENINSIDPTIIKSIAKFREDFDLKNLEKISILS
jgi:hypothetical protein